MKSKRRALALTVGALVLLGVGSTAAITVEEEPPAPTWVNADGTADLSAIPFEAAELLSDGRPNDNSAFESSVTSLPDGDTNPPGVTASDDPEDDSSEILEWEIPEPTCATQVSSGTGGSVSANICKITGQTAVNGALKDTASDGKCVTVRITVGITSKSWSACDGQTVKLDTGYLDGTGAQYAWSLR
ncbi:hypothetical protein ABT301_29710 [Streptomyces sp. NPDC000987]|uniref:hypothetical protein n=1 Tax=Streptomyces sp. NPDC000987 TaxID=3154374 RepID=UPI00332EF315